MFCKYYDYFGICSIEDIILEHTPTKETLTTTLQQFPNIQDLIMRITIQSGLEVYAKHSSNLVLQNIGKAPNSLTRLIFTTTAIFPETIQSWYHKDHIGNTNYVYDIGSVTAGGLKIICQGSIIFGGTMLLNTGFTTILSRSSNFICDVPFGSLQLLVSREMQDTNPTKCDSSAWEELQEYSSFAYKTINQTMLFNATSSAITKGSTREVTTIPTTFLRNLIKNGAMKILDPVLQHTPKLVQESVETVIKNTAGAYMRIGVSRVVGDIPVGEILYTILPQPAEDIVSEDEFSVNGYCTNPFYDITTFVGLYNNSSEQY